LERTVTDTNDTKSLDLTQHLELAAFHLYEACRSWSKIVLPSWADSDVDAMRTDARLRAMSAHRRGIMSCRGIARERIAAALAIADGFTWPACARTGAVDLLLDAQRRQRYRHVGGIIAAEATMYFELDADTEDERAAILEDISRQNIADRKLISEWQARIANGNGHTASTVSQLPKDSNR
jgi:hypothetical protein